jgi:FAD/FMN-containing dehydrogenase/Fe-S oxidoreductase
VIALFIIAGAAFPICGMNTRTNPNIDSYFEALDLTGFQGEVRRDLATRIVHATDNSIYQFQPAAVVHVRSAEDVACMLRLGTEEPFRPLSFSARGGGTGTNAQSLTTGIVVDCSKYLNRIHEINPEEGWAEVEPGVILDRLNGVLKPHGLFFAPNVSTSSRATIGGMISTDACGQGSRVYGRTSNHTLALQVVLADGSIHWIQAWDQEQLDRVIATGTRLADGAATVQRVIKEQAELIRARFPPINRFLTGYNLAHVGEFPGTLNLVPLICGSEGTLAMIVRARLRLTPLPKHRQLIVLKYAHFLDALDDAGPLQVYDPVAVETLDEKILERLREDEIFPRIRELLGDDIGKGTGATNFVEFTGDDPKALDAATEKLVRAIDAQSTTHPKVTGTVFTRDPAEIADLWEVRKRGVGLLGNLPGPRKPVAFVEDTAVPPTELANYVRSFRDLLDQHGVEYGMYGHVDAGCLHVRPALDLTDPNDESLVRTISDQVVALVQKHHGIMWGEHGRGLRSEYTPEFFGPELHRELRRIKEAFDPHNRLNPGKIVTPLSCDQEVRPIESPLKGQLDREISSSLRREYEKAFACNGNGACFAESVTSVMCPSYKATRDRVHSPKGRAMVMREWLRQGAPTSGEFAEEVRTAMAGCLACKACVTQCPIHVDVPEFKAQFQEAYFAGNRRPIRDQLVAGFERVAPLVSTFAPMAQILGSSGPARAIMRRIGLVDMPEFSVPNLNSRLSQAGFARLSRRDREKGGPGVILLQDAFTSLFEPRLVIDTCRVIAALGYRVRVHPFFENGKALHIKGYLRRLRKVAARNLPGLLDLQTGGYSLVAIEPSIALTYRDEYVRHGPASARELRVQTLQEWLTTSLPEGPLPGGDRGPDSVTLFPHCMESAGEPHLTQAWKPVFARFGVDLSIEPVGCCGMAGIYGHESEHADISRSIFKQNWEHRLGRSNGGTVLATGFSCRHQSERCTARSVIHPATYLASRI